MIDVLFDHPRLQGIRSGAVVVAFRRWRRPTVRPGTLLRTPAGLVAIESVDRLDPKGLTERDARQAGYADRAELLRTLRAGTDRSLYRVRVRFAGEDPRLSVGENDELTADEIGRIEQLLRGIDRRSRRGPWTVDVLRMLRQHPGVPARELAARLDRPTDRFKADVRTLKEHGLVQSLDVGYQLSPRGARVLRHLTQDETEGV